MVDTYLTTCGGSGPVEIGSVFVWMYTHCLPMSFDSGIIPDSHHVEIIECDNLLHTHQVLDYSRWNDLREPGKVVYSMGDSRRKLDQCGNKFGMY